MRLIFFGLLFLPVLAACSSSTLPVAPSLTPQPAPVTADTSPSPAPPADPLPSQEFTAPTSIPPVITASPAETPPPTATLATAPQPDSYLVVSGESIWMIAARREIYGDALLWPLIYRANRDQIKDPKQIYPGQRLRIPRNLSQDEIAEARTTGQNSEIFPLDQLLRFRPVNGR